MPSNQGAADSDPPAQERAPAAGRSRKRGGKIEPVVEDASPAQSGPNRNVIAIAIGAVAIVATVVVIVVSRLGGSSGPPVPAGWVRFHSSSPAYRIDYPKTWTPHYRNGTETFVGYGPSSAQGARGPIRAVTVVAQKVDSQTTLPDYLSTGENVLRGQGRRAWRTPTCRWLQCRRPKSNTPWRVIKQRVESRFLSCIRRPGVSL